MRKEPDDRAIGQLPSMLFSGIYVSLTALISIFQNKKHKCEAALVTHVCLFQCNSLERVLEKAYNLHGCRVLHKVQQNFAAFAEASE